LVSNVNNALSALVVLAQALIVALVLAKIFAGRDNKILNFIRENALGAALIVALTATLGSLFYSELAHFTPCKLCWYQRILMYPQVILLGIAWWKEDWGVRKYAIAMSALGALIAAFHYFEQLSAKPLLSCDTTGFSASCSERFVTTFGYITIPMMALSAFLLILVLVMAPIGASRSPNTRD